ncbi:sugar phosphate nucleotidyltransferase [Kitasatospora aureofaciens]|uniref:sugar phosphate nucleotidyltransferase n=1 Tax=Kitasatospora aureofaciens TaxID=1894 RepID=UPI0037C982B8
MKALVLSGGMGTRLRPFTYRMPEQMSPITNRPVLLHVMDNLRALGVREVGVSVGDRHGEIAAGPADSIVLTGATVRNVPGIHGSVIGRGAAVSSGRSRHRLLVGDDARVEVAV